MSQPCLLFITKEETNIAAARGTESQSKEIVWLPNLEQHNRMKPVIANIGIYDVFFDSLFWRQLRPLPGVWNPVSLMWVQWEEKVEEYVCC